MSELRSVHDEKVASIASDLSTKGYSVFVEPNSIQIPFDLAGYQPDLVATRGDEGLIVEVKIRSQRTDVERYQEIAERIAKHPGWKFLFMTLDTSPDLERSDLDKVLPSWEEIQARLDQVASLTSQGLYSPALLYIWAVLESALRRRALAIQLPVERFANFRMLKQMYSMGELSMQQFDSLRQNLEKRNATAHGIEFEVGLNDVQEVLDVATTLVASWAREQDAKRLTESQS